MSDKTPVAVLGATGAVGQRFISRLADHPFFELTDLVGKTSAGKPYGEAVNWILEHPIPESVREVEVADDEAPLEADIVFSALPSSAAGPIEQQHAKAGRAVFTNAKNHRMDRDVPLVVPDLNPDHIGMVEDRDGFIVANPNCSAIISTTPLAPLQETYGLDKVTVTTLQALSGAGYPGVPSLDATANVIPYIGNEEDKIETEPLKILGQREGPRITHLDVAISATATRVPVTEGHTCVLNVSLREEAAPEAIKQTLADYTPGEPVASLPSAPERTITVLDAPDRPQPRYDAMIQDGMGVAVGRVRRDPTGTVKLVVLGSNTVRGAAGCSVMNAELARETGIIG